MRPLNAIPRPRATVSRAVLALALLSGLDACSSGTDAEPPTAEFSARVTGAEELRLRGSARFAFAPAMPGAARWVNVLMLRDEEHSELFVVAFGSFEARRKTMQLGTMAEQVTGKKVGRLLATGRTYESTSGTLTIRETDDQWMSGSFHFRARRWSDDLEPVGPEIDVRGEFRAERLIR